MIHHTNKRKDKNHRVISIDTEKAFDKIQHPFMIKIPIKVGVEETYRDIINDIYDKPIANILFISENLKAFPLKSGRKRVCPFLHFYLIQYWKS